MRTSVSIIAMSVTLLVLAADAATAQTAAPAPMSKSALRQQDRAECTKQVTRYQADLYLMCLANREAARKAAAKKQAAEERAKLADCKKQAAAQKLHFAKRLRFIETCFVAK